MDNYCYASEDILQICAEGTRAPHVDANAWQYFLDFQ